MALRTVTLQGKYQTLKGDPATGTVSFELSGPLLDSAGNVIYPKLKRVEPLDSEGAFSVVLPATKGDVSTAPQGLTYKINEAISPGLSHVYAIELDADLGTTQQLADIAPATNVTVQTYALVSTLNAHTVATENVHGIADTSQLATLADVAANVPEWGNIDGTLSAQTDLATALAGKADAADVTTVSTALTSHSAATTGVHGIAATADLLLSSRNFSDIANVDTARSNLRAQLELGWVVAEQYGVVADGTTLNTTALQAAVTAAGATKPLILPPGVILSGPIVAPDGITLIGGGIGGWSHASGVATQLALTTLRATSAGTLLTIGQSGASANGHRSTLSGVELDGNSVGTDGISIYDWYGTQLVLEHSVIHHFTSQGITSPSPGVHAFLMCWNDVTVMSCDIGVNLVGHFQASTFRDCYFSANTTAGAILSEQNTNLTHGIHLDGCRWDFVQGGAVGLDLTDCRHASLNGCYFELDGGSTSMAIKVAGATFATNVYISGSYFLGNGTGATTIQVTSAAQPVNLNVEGSLFKTAAAALGGSALGSATVNVRGCDFASTPVFRTRNTGTATVVNGTTSIVVSHGLYGAPTLVQLTPTTSLGTATRFWVSTITSTQFTLNLDTAPAANVSFNWSAEVTGPVTVAPTTLLSASFTAANGTLLTAYTPEIGGAFTATLGSSPVINSNQLGAGVANETEYAMVNVGVTDMTVSASITHHTNSNAQIVARMTDSNNAIIAGVASNGDVNFAKRVGGVVTDLRGGVFLNYADGETHTFTLTCTDTTVQVKVDGTTTYTVTVTDLTSNTGAGVTFVGSATTSRIDSLLVTSP